MNRNEQVTGYIEQASAPFNEVMKELRTLIQENVPGVSEAFKWGQPVFRKSKDFCYLKATRNHVNLGFMEVQKLSDPDGVLEGTGKSMRHVKIRSVSDIKEELFRTWLREATF